MEHKKKILVVDDNEINRSLLADILSGQYEVIEAENGLVAVDILRRQYSDIALVLLDIVMPEMDGFEVLAMMNSNRWLESVPVVMISAEVSSTYIDHAYDLGATDYITRPFDEKTVMRRVQNTILLYTKQKYLENLVTEQIMEKERTNSQMVEVLSNIVEFRNGESGLHVLHIRVITNMLLQSLKLKAPELGLTAAKIALIANASAMHDIGKISIDEKILNKPGKFTDEEYEIMKTHTVIGAQVIEDSPQYANSELLQVVHDICRWHHERYDGRGYPDGLKGEEIPVAAQVVALADVYDALTSERCYKKAFSHEKAVQMILDGECGAFSPRMLECFLEISDQIKKDLEIHSPRAVSNIEIQRVASEVMSHSELRISNRTITLLEQERIKYHFFASMTKEIMFEYDRGTEILEFSEWGAKYLGVPELIQAPLSNAALETIDKGFVTKVQQLCEKTTPLDPIASTNCRLTVDGKFRWFKLVARTLWDSEDQPTYTRIIGKLIDIHEEQMRLNELTKLASQDPLTELYNHKTAREMIEALLAERSSENFLFMIFDLDDFKSANDRFGHSFGDKVLKTVAKNIRRSTRRYDIAARIGGDEFLLFLPFKDHPERLAERLISNLSVQLEEYPISLSMGAAVCPGDGKKYQELFRRADAALYKAKGAGKSVCRFYDAEMQDIPTSQRTPIENGGETGGENI